MPPLLGERRNDMAIRYVKDFEFPAAAGFTDSATKVTGQMYAKGGEAKAPKGKEMVLLIGVGMPKKPPMKKAEGSYVDQDDYMAQLEKKSPIQSGTYMDRMTGAAKKEYDKFKANVQAFRKPTPKNKNPEKRTPGDVQGGGEPGDVPVKGYIPMHMQKALAARTPGNVPVKGYIPGTNVEASDIMDADERARLERGYKSGGKVAKVMHEFGEGKLHSGSKKGPEVTNPKQAMAIALSEAGKSKKSRGGIEYVDGGKDTSVSVKDVKSGKVKQSRDRDYYREMEQMKKPAFKKGGMMKHEDEAMDRKLVKQMIKPAALKKMGGGMAEKKMMHGGMAQKVQMAKSDAIEKSMKGEKKTPMASGGIASRSPLQAMGMAPRGMSLKQARGVPVGPRAPMISPLATGAGPMAAAAANRPAMGSRGVGVNEARAGKPDVGAIRMAMAKAASAANPESAPAMMKRGGKTSMSKC